MAPAQHTHSIHIEAPVETVFSYVEKPENLIGVMTSAKSHPTVREVHTTEDGKVASYDCDFHELGMHLSAVFTREDYVENQRIADRSSKGVLFTVTVEPDGAGTALTYGWSTSKLNEVLDAILFHADRDLQKGLPHVKEAIEALTSA